jgi:hypothetical protein
LDKDSKQDSGSFEQDANEPIGSNSQEDKKENEDVEELEEIGPQEISAICTNVQSKSFVLFSIFYLYSEKNNKSCWLFICGFYLVFTYFL